MSRKLMRVPMDFAYPLNTKWVGYLQYNPFCLRAHIGVKDNDGCIAGCVEYAKIKGISIGEDGCPEFNKFYGLMENDKLPLDPPTGEGYQLWETVSEGSPLTPVYATLDDLCEYCADNVSLFAHDKISKERWKELLSKEDFIYQIGNCLYV